MPLALHDPRFDTVIAFIRMQSDGATLDQVRAKFTPPLPVRTARRLMHNLGTLGVLTTTGGNRYCRYHLRQKPGPFGSVVWFHPDSSGGAMILGEMPAPAPAKPRRPRTPAPKVPAVVPTATPPAPPPAPQPSDGAAIQRSHESSEDKPPPRQSAGRVVTPLTAAADTTPKVAAVVPTATSPKPPAARPRSQPAPAPASASPLSTLNPPAVAQPMAGAHLSTRPPLPPQFAQLFAASAPRVISYAGDRSRTQLYLESAAAIEGLTPPEMKAYIPAALAQLDTLTPDQAAHLGIPAADYTAWREAYPAVGP